MTVHYGNGFRDAGGRMVAIDSERRELSESVCFLCAEPPRYPMVVWHGAGGTQTILLHEECAGSLVLRLARDAWEVEHERKSGRIGENGELLQP